VVLGVVGVSNAIRYFLARFEKATLGFLLGLLLGAVIGLWPFQRGRLPEPGETIKGVIITAENVAAVEAEDYPLETFPPRAAHASGAVALIVIGFGITHFVAWIGGGQTEDPVEGQAVASSEPR
jgi:hypothetical protein